MTCTTPLTVDGVAVPMIAQLPLSQTYSKVSGSSPRRAWSGRMLLRTRWERYATSIRGQGWMPEGLGEIKMSQSYVLGCGAALSVNGVGPVVVLPTDSRTDVTPFARAIDASGEVLGDTDVALAGRNATVTAVAGATGYVVAYFPLLTVSSQRGPQISSSATARQFSFSLDFEEFN